MDKTRKTELDLDVIENIAPAVVPEQPKKKEPEKKKRLVWRPGKKTIILISVVFILILGVAGLLIVVLQKDSVEEKDEELISTIQPPKVETIPLHTLAPFLLPINAKKGKERFLKIGIALELTELNLDKEISKNIALVRGEIFRLIKKKSLSKIRSPAARKRMRKDIKNIVNMALQTGTIKKVYFTELTLL